MAAAVARACVDPVVTQRMDPLGAIMVGNTPAEFAAWLAVQRGMCEQVIRDAGITLG
jgi:tripartite-type tricarboxylate transporter receptor subunit TctC